jgi:hypothetical protein
MTRRQEGSQQPADITGASRLPPGSSASPAPARVLPSFLPACCRPPKSQGKSGQRPVRTSGTTLRSPRQEPALSSLRSDRTSGQLVTYPPGPRSRRPAVRMAAAHPPPRVGAALAIRARNLAGTIQSTAADANRRRARGSCRGGRLHPSGSDTGERLERFAADVAAGRTALRSMMAALGLPVRRYKGYAASVAEKAARLKLNGSLWSRSPLSGVVELEILRLDVEGRAAAWRTLRARAERDPRPGKEQLNELLPRAARQSEAPEELRAIAASRTITRASGLPGSTRQGWTTPVCPCPREARDTRASCGAAGQAAMAWLRDVRRWRSAPSWVA